ncbi:MAG: pyridoxal-phosphate dependent enzyme [Bacillota bacterium]
MMTPLQLKERLDRFPRAPLGIFPTPLQPLLRLGESIGCPELYMKRDDLTGLGMGGNKTRSLEFLLGEALSSGADTVITSGAPQSNLCCLTAAACARLGLDCILIHNSRPPESLTGNLFLSHLSGAELRFVGEVDESHREEIVWETAGAMGARAYAVHSGGSTPRGALGYTWGAAELCEQVSRRGIELKHVVIVGAMGGTASGFIAGNVLLGAPFLTHVISVEYSREVLRGLLEDIVGGVLELLGVRPSGSPFDAVEIYDEFLGDGYGAANEATLEAARRVARTEGIFCETVYVAKTTSGLIGLIRRGDIPSGEAVCVWHTGGHPTLFTQTHLFSG